MTITSKKDVALSVLFGQPGETVEDVKFFRGDSSSATEDDFWGEVHEALFQERMGSATVSEVVADNSKMVDAKAFLLSL